MDQRTLNMQDRRDRIVDAAERLIMRDSLSAFTMRSLADEVGLSVKTLYNLCNDKEAIAAEVEDRAYATLEAELTAMPLDPDPTRQVIAIMSAAAEKAIKRKAIILPLLRAPDESGTRTPRRPLGFFDLGMRMVQNELARAVRLGLLKTTLNPKILAKQLTLNWFGTAMMWGKQMMDDAEFVSRVEHIGYCNMFVHAEGDTAAVLRTEIARVETKLS